MKNIKKLLFVFTISIFTFFLSYSKISAKEVNVYIFYGKECPHCEAALKYLTSIEKKYDLNIVKYEVWHDTKNQEIMKDIGEYLDFNVRGVPFVIIDNTPISGFMENNTEETYRYHIKQASKDSFYDDVGVKLGVVKEEKKTTSKKSTTVNKNEFMFNVPLIGKVNLKNMSLPIVSIVLGLIDGFNPCAMWVLLFLISTLIGMKDKKRLWILGLTFLITSSLVYLLFMLSFLEFAKFINGVSIIRFLIAIVALIGGIINLKSYIKSIGKDDGCDVISEKKRKKYFKKIKEFTHEKKFILALLGTILLAASVNVIELACSAGIPVIFTSLLAMNNLSGIQYFIYILIYILFFMLDDLVIFAISVKSMELTGMSTKYSKYSHLIGGILMLIISILLLVKPEWLMFNF